MAKENAKKQFKISKAMVERETRVMAQAGHSADKIKQVLRY
jgi:hypothetical protein